MNQDDILCVYPFFSMQGYNRGLTETLGIVLHS